MSCGSHFDDHFGPLHFQKWLHLSWHSFIFLFFDVIVVPETEDESESEVEEPQFEKPNIPGM